MQQQQQQQRGTKERRPLSKRPLKKKLEGKTFYLDNVKKHKITTLCEAIYALGGRVESFLHKDVSFVVTESKDGLKQDKPVAAKEGPKDKSEEQQPPKQQQESCLSREKQRPGTPRPAACGSRGKALLEKAIRNNERLQGSSVLSNARSWGVKILSVEDALLYLKKLTKESSIPKQYSPVVKASTLNTPYLKIEDFNRKYKPLFTLYATFPGLCHLSRCSPLASPPPLPWFEQWAEQVEHKTREKKAKSVSQEKSQTSSLPWLICKKDTSYCECCRQTFTCLKEHLQSDAHRSFATDPSNYSVVDEVGAEMFDPNLFRPYEETLKRPPTPSPVEEVCEMELQAAAEPEPAEPSFNTLTAGAPRSPLPGGLVNMPPRLEFTAPSPENVPPDIQPFGQETNSESCPLSPAMPVLHVEPQVQASLPELPEVQHLPPCLLPDPYSLPPVLSPQVPRPSDSMDPYSDPPVLSPYAAEETAEGQPCEINFSDILTTLISGITVSPSSPPLNSGSGTDTEEVNGTRRESFAELSAVAPNPRKRRRSAGSEHGHRKHKRTVKCGDVSSWTGRIHEPTKPQSDFIAEVERNNQITQSAPVPGVFWTPGQSTVDMLGSYTSYLTTPNQIDSFAYQPSHPPSSTVDPALDSAGSRSHSSLCNREDSARSQSLSTSVSIEPSLIPNPAALASSSSDSEWDCGLLSRLGPASAASRTPAAATATATAQSHGLDKELLHRPCPRTYDAGGYESHLHTILQQSTTVCADDKDISAISRSVAQIAEVQ